MSFERKVVRHLNTVDLTGEEPVYDRQTLVKKVPVIDLEDDGEKRMNAIDGTDCDSSKSFLCEVCQQRISKYTCPGCSKKTCCLLCVQNHKSQSGCNGTRDKTGFVMKSKFNNLHLLSDYRFLEEVDRITDNAKRDYKIKSCNHQIGKRGFILRKACLENNIKLFRMANGMTRMKENRSRYIIREKTIYWTVKFIFCDINYEVVDKFSENDLLQDILSPYLDETKCTPQNRKRFSAYLNRGATDDHVHVLFKNELNSEDGNRKYSVVDILKSIKESLIGKSILEYPIYYVALSKKAEALLKEPFQIKQEEDELSPSVKSPEAKRRKIENV